MVTDTPLQLTSEKIPLFELWRSIKDEYLQLSKKAIKVLSLSVFLSKVDFLHVLPLKEIITMD